jgi:hypothetical protein
MKTQIALLLAVVKTVLSLPAQQVISNGGGLQMPEEFEGKLLPTAWPGIDLDLNERRLVQFEGAESPVWMTELDKVSLLHQQHFLTRSQAVFQVLAKMAGKKFFDM